MLNRMAQTIGTSESAGLWGNTRGEGFSSSLAAKMLSDPSGPSGREMVPPYLYLGHQSISVTAPNWHKVGGEASPFSMVPGKERLLLQQPVLHVGFAPGVVLWLCIFVPGAELFGLIWSRVVWFVFPSCSKNFWFRQPSFDASLSHSCNQATGYAH